MTTKRAKENMNRNPELAARVKKALTRAGESARRTAKMYGTPVYILKDGKIVAIKP